MSTKSTPLYSKLLPKDSGIYLITNRINGKVWVGQGKGKDGILGRYRSHRRSFQRKANSPHLQRAWDLYGEEAFSWEVLVLCPIEQCNHWENYYLELFQSWSRERGYNIDKQSKGLGRVSEETRKRIGEANRGRNTGPRSEEIKLRMSENRRAAGNKPRTLESNIKNGNSHRGTKHKPFSEEVKQRLSHIHKALRERWITDGATNKRIRKDQSLPEGWRFGRVRNW